MRLIDADKFKRQIATFIVGYGGDIGRADALCGLIDIQPTAFDKKKVIEQLDRCRVYQFQGMLPDGRVCHFSDVIEIVEKGGIE